MPGQRLDLAVTQHLADLSRSEVQRLIKAGHVLVNGAPSKASYRIEGGEEVRVNLPPPVATTLLAEDIPLSVLYEDSDLIAIDKPAGMVVHPATSHQSGTLVNAALARWPELRSVGGEERAGVVHRLDKDTSGVILLAKTDAALADLQGQFKQREVQKRYLALVEGMPESSEGIIDAPLSLH
jgi:23S rRNA pseudouridine1911/1915/1917 synthase